jgi:hypothetical protein
MERFHALQCAPFGTSLLIDPVWHGDQERSFHILLHRVACQGEFQASLLSTHLAKQLMPRQHPHCPPKPLELQTFDSRIYQTPDIYLIGLDCKTSFVHPLKLIVSKTVGTIESSHQWRGSSSSWSIWKHLEVSILTGQHLVRRQGGWRRTQRHWEESRHSSQVPCDANRETTVDEPLKRLLVINFSSLRVGKDSIGFHVT